MDEFINFLAERKHQYYHLLYKFSPQAYTSEECYNRIKTKAKYEEILLLINYLPLEQQKVVEERFKELKQ